MVRGRTTRRVVLALAVTAMAALLVPVTASAQGAYRSVAWSGCDGGFNSGSFDTAGRTYVPCGNPTVIGVYAPSGALVQSIPLDRYVTDVEPVGDGSLLYLAGYAAPVRLVRQAGGTYVHDTRWQPQTYPFEGGNYPAAGLFVDSDAAGNVYYADGYWASGRHTVVQYDQAGRYVTRFGAYKKESWGIGDFYWALGGIAVSPDGRRVLTTETGNNRLQIWTRDANEVAFTPAAQTFGGNPANNADRGGYCDFVNWRGAFAAPYDVNLDAAGNVYVINTTCKQVLRFTPDLSQLTANVDVRVNGADYPRPHGFTVGADGTVFVGENQRALIPAGSTASIAAPPVRAAETAAAVVRTPVAPIAPIAEGAPVPPAAAARAFATSFTVRAPVSRRSATRQYIYGTARCTRRCSIAVRVRASGKLLATHRSKWDGRAKKIVIVIPRRRSGGALTFVTTATAVDGTTARHVRTYRIAR